MHPLSSRQESILHRVVDTHIHTGQPVGSRFITNRYREIFRDYYSPATVRHEMGVLEERGYLMHPHTSAGRIPTDRGYRFYVDHGMKPEPVSQALLRHIAEELSTEKDEIENFTEKASQILSRLAEAIALLALPQISFRSKVRFKVSVKGASQILGKPEFQERTKVQPLFQLFENRSHLSAWIDTQTRRGFSVMIGSENEPHAFQHYSVVSADFILHGENKGMIALIGPKRMPYGRVLPLVKAMAQAMEYFFETYAEESAS